MNTQAAFKWSAMIPGPHGYSEYVGAETADGFIDALIEKLLACPDLKDKVSAMANAPKLLELCKEWATLFCLNDYYPDIVELRERTRLVLGFQPSKGVAQ